MSPQHADHVDVDRDRTCSALGLGSTNDRTATNLGDLPYHEQTLTIEVDVLPAQPDRLTATGPGDQQQVVQVREPVVSNALEERPALCSGPGFGSFGVLRRQLDVIGRNVRDERAFDRGVEG